MKKIYILASAALALNACDNRNSDDLNTVTSSDPLQVTATIDGSVPSRAVDQAWNKNDSIGITTTFNGAVGPFINMKYITEDGSDKFTGDPIYFYKPMEIAAYYPFTGNQGTAPGVIEVSTAAANQTAVNQRAIDCLYAKLDNPITSVDQKNINFTFAHCMSKLSFIFKKGNDGTDLSKIASYQIGGLVLDGTFDTATGVCALKDDATDATLDISLSDGDKTISADGAQLQVPSLILLPQTIAGGKATLKITDSDSQDYACTLPFDGGTIKPGTNYQYTITVSRAGITIQSSAIADWTPNPLEAGAGSAD